MQTATPWYSQVSDAVLPVLLLPEEAALILDEGLVSISIIVPSSGQISEQAVSGNGARGVWWQEEGGKVIVPHLPPANHGEAAGESGLHTVALRRSAERTREWGLPAQELRGLNVCGHGDTGRSICKSPGSQKRAREEKEQAPGANEGLPSRQKDGAGEKKVEDAESDAASQGWRALWSFPATEVR